jgi:hypothetical protein
MCERFGVNRVGFRRSAARPGELAHVPGVEHRHRNTLRQQPFQQSFLVSTARLERHQFKLAEGDHANQASDTARIILGLDPLGAWPEGHVQGARRYIDADKTCALHHLPPNFAAPACTMRTPRSGQLLELAMSNKFGCERRPGALFNGLKTSARVGLPLAPNSPPS